MLARGLVPSSLWGLFIQVHPPVHQRRSPHETPPLLTWDQCSDSEAGKTEQVPARIKLSSGRRRNCGASSSTPHREPIIKPMQWSPRSLLKTLMPQRSDGIIRCPAVKGSKTRGASALQVREDSA
ncbi:hypothetical protein AAFF_G00414350 [Aldrovandia affinis]|uniref:Uncharacterized protein n=1 Tax=Aldrovandia affinis TaxID=143900 RepID=A0AAD7WJ86_9TELE|nr:hypothetical protein AAFF_G00414350 [Aldrovandia affinis]